MAGATRVVSRRNMRSAVGLGARALLVVALLASLRSRGAHLDVSPPLLNNRAQANATQAALPRLARVHPPPASPTRGQRPAPAADVGGETAPFSLSLEQGELVLRTPQGALVATLPAHIDARIEGKEARMSGQWQSLREGLFAAQLEADHARVHLALQHQKDSPLLQVDIEVHYLEDVQVDYEQWAWQMHSGEAQVLDRAYRLVPLPRRGLFLDRWTPRVGAWRVEDQTALTLLGNDTFEGAWFRSDAIVWELDHADNHPHTVLDECYGSYAHNRPWRSHARTRRVADERVQHRMQWVVGAGHPPLLARWPEGRHAAIAIVDHADAGNAARMRAIAYGSSERDAVPSPGQTPRGLLGHGLAITKTVFDDPAQLQDPAFRAVIDQLHAGGSEIAPHSITEMTDEVSQIRASMATSFHPYAPRTWVDHQPDTNCEGINNRGGIPAHRDNRVELLASLGLPYLWEAPDPLGWRGLNLFRPHTPHDRAVSFYPALSLRTGDVTPWLFRSTWLFVPTPLIVERLAPRELDQLQREGGLLIAHTYFSRYDASADPRSILLRNRAGHLQIKPAYDAVLGELARRHRAGHLWVTPLRELGDWLSYRKALRVQTRSPTLVSVEDSAQPRTAAPGDYGLLPWPGSTLQASDESSGGLGAGTTLRVVPFVYDPTTRLRFEHPDARLAQSASREDP